MKPTHAFPRDSTDPVAIVCSVGRAKRPRYCSSSYNIESQSFDSTIRHTYSLRAYPLHSHEPLHESCSLRGGSPAGVLAAADL